MLKSTTIALSILFSLFSFIHGNPHDLHGSQSSSSVTFIKPKPNVMRRINPLKLFFTVVHTPEQEPHYSVEWNLSLLKNMLLESPYVKDDDKILFLTQFSDENDYANWSPEKHDQFERFTEQYFSIYKAQNLFLPLKDCQSLTYAILDEMINNVQPAIDDEKRSKARAKAVEHFCNAE